MGSTTWTICLSASKFLPCFLTYFLLIQPSTYFLRWLRPCPHMGTRNPRQWRAFRLWSWRWSIWPHGPAWLPYVPSVLGNYFPNPLHPLSLQVRQTQDWRSPLPLTPDRLPDWGSNQGSPQVILLLRVISQLLPLFKYCLSTFVFCFNIIILIRKNVRTPYEESRHLHVQNPLLQHPYGLQGLPRHPWLQDGQVLSCLQVQNLRQRQGHLHQE